MSPAHRPWTLQTVTDVWAGWRDEAACGEKAHPTSEADWLAHDGTSLETAVNICENVCPVARQCLEDAATDPQAEGVRGGILFTGGRVTRTEAGKARRKYGMTLKVRSNPRKKPATVDSCPQPEESVSTV